MSTDSGVYTIPSSNDAQTILSSEPARPISISAESDVMIAAPMINLEPDEADRAHSSGPSTIEHIEPSEQSQSPRSISSESSNIELLRAQDEVAQRALEAAKARARLLEAEARTRRSTRTSATISSSPPVPEEQEPVVELPLVDVPAPPRGGPAATRAKVISRARADQSRQPTEDSPSEGVATARIRALEEQIARLESERRTATQNVEHKQDHDQEKDNGAGVGPLEELLFLDPVFRSAESSFNYETPRQSTDLLDLNTPPRRGAVSDNNGPRINNVQGGAAQTVDLLTLTPPRITGDEEHGLDQERHKSRHADERIRADLPPLPDFGEEQLHRDLLLRMGTQSGTQRDGSDTKADPTTSSRVNDELGDMKTKVKELEKRLEVRTRNVTGGSLENPPGLFPPPSNGIGDQGTDDPKRTSDVKLREADNIKIPHMPSTPFFDEWQAAVRQEVVSASGRGQPAFDWVLEVEDENSTFESLQDPGMFPSLDAKLASAIARVAKGRIAKRLSLKTKELARKRMMISGRQSLWVAYKEYSYDEERGTLYGLSDLMSLRNPDAEKEPSRQRPESIEAFIDEWDATLQAMKDEAPDNLKEVLFYEQVKNCHAIAPEIAEYDRARPGHQHKTYEFLYDSVIRYVNRTKYARNRKAKLLHMKGLSTHGVNALPVHDAPHEEESKSSGLGTQDAQTAAPAAPAKGKAKGRTGSLSKEELERRKTLPCRNFMKPGGCKFGDQCQYKHEVVNATVCREIRDQDPSTITGDDQSDEIGMVSTNPDEVGPAHHRVKNWVVDTGSGNHIVCRAHVDNRHIHRQRPIEKRRLQTANGVVEVDKVLNVSSGTLGTDFDAIIMDNTANVVSLGKLCMENGCTFVWQAHAEPWLMAPDGKDIPIHLDHLVPMMAEMPSHPAQSYAVPAPHGSQESPDEGTSGEQTQYDEESPKYDDDQEDGDDEHCDHEDGAMVPADSEPKEQSRAERLQKEATSVEHLLTHLPKNPFCDTCQRAKLFRQQARRQDPDDRMQPENFGDLVHADHVIIGRRKFNHGVGGQRCALFVYDRATGIEDAPALRSKGAKLAENALKHFTKDQGKSLFSDNAPELVKAAESLGWIHATSTPHRPEGNSLTERRIGVAVQGTRCNLVQSGLPHMYWPFALRHSCFARNVTARDDEPAPYDKLHGEPYAGHVIPFGALVNFRKTPIARRKGGKFDSPTAQGLFLCPHVDPGYQLRGDVLIVAVEDLLGDNRHGNKIPIYRLKQKEVIPVEPFRFPMQMKESEEQLDRLARIATPDEENDDDDRDEFAFDFQEDLAEGMARDREIKK